MPFKLLLTLLLASPLSHAQDNTAPLRNALAQQSRHRTVSVGVRQTRKIPALKDPVVRTGHLWLQPGKAFRWQLGQPPAQTAVFDGSRVHFIDEKKKTISSIPPDDRRAKPLLLMLGIGQGASYDGLLEAFTIAATNTVREHFIASLLPKGSVKRALTSMVMQVNTRTSFLERIEWTQKDGTVVITEFSPPTLNQPLPENIFQINPAQYTPE